MRVTDCGCFGDFLTIEPKMSFMKDLFLLIPSFIFVFKFRDMHQLFNRTTRNILVSASTVGLIWYCLSNFAWDLPHKDFRPFQEGVNIKEKRQAELEAAGNVRTTHWTLKNKKTGDLITLENDVYMKGLTSDYSKDKWGYVSSVVTEPSIKPTKLSDFIVSDENGDDMQDALLEDQDYRFWIVSYYVPYDLSYETLHLPDTTFATDTIQIAGSDEEQIVRSISNINKKEMQKPLYTFDPAYIKSYKKDMLDLIAKSGIPSVAILGGVDPQTVEGFKQALEINMPVYEADELLLKTIIRSNPGLVLMKDGVVVKKWHKENLPAVDEIKRIMGQ